MTPRIGDPAPEIHAHAYVCGSHDPEPFDVHDLRGRWVAIIFYPAAASLVSPVELRAFAAAQPEFDALGASVIAASAGGFWSHRAWLEIEPALAAANMPLIADRNGAVAASYGIRAGQGAPERATFVIDPDGILRYAAVAGRTFGRAPDDVLRVIGALQTEQEYGAGWQPAVPALGVAA